MSAGHTHASHGGDGGPVPVVCAWRRTLSLVGERQRTGDELVAAVRSFLAHLRSSLRQQGCRLIGHVKGLVEAGDAGRLLFSVTSFEGEPSIRAELQGPIRECTFTVNAIVFGADEEAVAAAVYASAHGHLDPWRPEP